MINIAETVESLKKLDRSALIEKSLSTYQTWFDTNDFDYIKISNTCNVILGIHNGLWDDVNEHGEPVKYHIFDTNLEPSVRTMSHVLWKLDLYPSISRANKDGWNKPLVKGVTKFGKKFIKII